MLLGRTTAHGKTWRVWFKGYMACAFVRTLGTLCQFFFRLHGALACLSYIRAV